MAVTRRVHIVKARAVYKNQVGAGDGGEFAQFFTDPAVDALLGTLAPAERIVGILGRTAKDGKNLIYIFTESFGLGPLTKGP